VTIWSLGKYFVTKPASGWQRRHRTTNHAGDVCRFLQADALALVERLKDFSFGQKTDRLSASFAFRANNADIVSRADLAATHRACGGSFQAALASALQGLDINTRSELIGRITG
jgi:hypothetical protein